MAKTDTRPSHTPEARRKYYQDNIEQISEQHRLRRRNTVGGYVPRIKTEHKGVELEYPDGVKDRMSLTEYKRWKAGDFPEGTKVWINGVRAR